MGREGGGGGGGGVEEGKVVLSKLELEELKGEIEQGFFFFFSFVFSIFLCCFLFHFLLFIFFTHFYFFINIQTTFLYIIYY